MSKKFFNAKDFPIELKGYPAISKDMAELVAKTANEKIKPLLEELADHKQIAKLAKAEADRCRAKITELLGKMKGE